MHVLVTADTVTPGWSYTRELVTGLAARGLQVTLVSFGELPLPEQVSWIGSLHGVSYIPTAFRVEWMQDAEAQFQESSSFLAGLVRDVKPDVLQLGQFCYGDLPVEVPRVIFAHGDPKTRALAIGLRPQPRLCLGRWYGDRIESGIMAADAVVASTGWMLQAVRACYAAPRRQVVIRPGRNPMLYHSRATKEDRVLTVGRMQDAAQQVALLTDRAQVLPVCIVWREPLTPVRNIPIRADVQTTIGRAPVAMRGPQSDGQMRAQYGRCSIYAAPARYEPLGLATIEAALSRCAIVANDIPSLREMWGEAALYFAANDADSLYQTLRKLHDDPELRHGYAERAYLRARARFTTKNMVDDYLVLYRSLMSGAPSADAAA